MAFGFYSPISINAAQVPTTQTDFPVLVNVTDARFKTVGNSGHVQNSSGFDIRPYTDSTLSTAITGYELERYNASTGEVVMWVKVSSLSSSTTPFVLAYGDSGISTDGSSSTTWSNSFLRVLHLGNGSSLSVVDSTGLETWVKSVSNPTATTGQIDGAMNLVTANTQWLEDSAFCVPTAITFSCWANATSFPGSNNSLMGKGASSVNYAAIDILANGKLNVEVLATDSRHYNGTGSHTLSTGTWYYIGYTYDSTSGLIGYVNAASDGTVAANGALNTTNQHMFIGANLAFNCCFWNGALDEVRFASVARSADWITTEYNNQSAPGTFETLGTEVSVNPIMGLFVISSFFKSPLTADHLQVPSDQTDFPILIDKTDNRFKTMGNGGHVQNANGYDIRPYSDSGLTTPLTYELEYYNASTGQVVMWVKRSTLSSSVDTVTYFRYGDASITTDGSSTTTWSNSFEDVYHFADGTTLSFNSSAPSGHNGTGGGVSGIPVAATGQIDGALTAVSANGQFMDTGAITQSPAITMSAWVNATSFPNAYNSVILRNQANADYVGILVKSTGKLAMLVGTTSTDRSYDGTGSNTLSAATWYYLTLTYGNAGGLIGYVNAASDGTHAGGAILTSLSTSNNVSRDPVNAGRFWNGKIDELRVSTVVRAPDWITTEYNNQKPSSTFITLGAESSA